MPDQAINNSEQIFVTAGTDINYNIIGNGIDDTTNIYFNFGAQGVGGASVIFIRPDQTCLITSVNGITLKDPITVTTGSVELPPNGRGLIDFKISKLTIHTTIANTTVRILAIG